MREIKFRGWDKKDKVIRKVVGMSFYHESVSLDIEYGRYLQDDIKRFELMQYTGLNDKNGTEIYEGDIVKIINNLQENEVDYNAQIIFKDGGFCAIDGTEDNFGVRRYRLSDFDLELEVIGNVWEHSHLLEGVDK